MADSWQGRAARQQAILNAQEIRPRRLQRELHPEVPVRARIVWDHEGEQTIETVAIA